MTTGIIRAGFVTLTLLLLAGCTTTHRWQQQLTLVFATPDGEVRASVVHSVSVNIGWKITRALIGDYGRLAEIDGEALIVDLGRGNVVFALIPSAFLAERAGLLRYQGGMGRWVRRLPDIEPVLITENMSLHGDIRPTLVRFRDLSDPSTLEVVDPDDLEARFGPGYALKSITLAGVDAPRTQGRIKTVLPWLKELGRTRFYLVETPEGLAPPWPKRYTIGPALFDTELTD